MTSEIQNEDLNILFKKLKQAFKEETTNFIQKGVYYYMRVSKDELKTVARARLTFKLKRKKFLEILKEIKQKFLEKNEEDININVRVCTYAEVIEVNANAQTNLQYSKLVKIIDLRDLTKRKQYEEYLKELKMLRKILRKQKKIIAEKNDMIKREKELERLKEVEKSYVKLKDENCKLKKIIQNLLTSSATTVESENYAKS